MLEGYLRCIIFNNQKNWEFYLPLAEWWYNTTFHSSIKLTPFEALYGYSPPKFAMSSAPRSVVELVNLLLGDRQPALSQLKANLTKAQNGMKQFADKKRSEWRFEKGDWVYLKLQPHRKSLVSGKGNHKLNSKFHGPFEITRKIGEACYRLKLPVGFSMHPVFHVSQLKGSVGEGQIVTLTLPLMGSSEAIPKIP